MQPIHYNQPRVLLFSLDGLYFQYNHITICKFLSFYEIDIIILNQVQYGYIIKPILFCTLATFLKNITWSTSDKLDKIIKLIDECEYFMINRPRRYGKTTTLDMFERNLSERYAIIRISLEGLSELPCSSEQVFIETIFRQINGRGIFPNLWSSWMKNNFIRIFVR
ncbi:hypothetical protein A3207_00840 [Candidatus Methanomassiliicoccus intestinalis]|uniref:AAA-ATPase-like domain-containing protein n=2 Tax=Candidatus Methanomassiliicoccus intestinalis TaxID=1406512 RepID=A0A8J8PH91_9ARCH|nr:MAG: hypothetical protein A3207_00840 [Candidatus Methanomassiliicoccus intestinalis]